MTNAGSHLRDTALFVPLATPSTDAPVASTFQSSPSRAMGVASALYRISVVRARYTTQGSAILPVEQDFMASILCAGAPVCRGMTTVVRPAIVALSSSLMAKAGFAFERDLQSILETGQPVFPKLYNLFPVLLFFPCSTEGDCH